MGAVDPLLRPDISDPGSEGVSAERTDHAGRGSLTCGRDRGVGDIAADIGAVDLPQIGRSRAHELHHRLAEADDIGRCGLGGGDGCHETASSA